MRQATSNMVDVFVQQHSDWLNRKRSSRPSAVVIPKSSIEWWAVEHPHEFYSAPGWATPIDMSTPSASHLDLNFLGKLLEDYPDQDLASDIILGVRYKADLRSQVVLQPHLFSFLPVQAKYLAEAVALWSEVGRSCTTASRASHGGPCSVVPSSALSSLAGRE